MASGPQGCAHTVETPLQLAGVSKLPDGLRPLSIVENLPVRLNGHVGVDERCSPQARSLPDGDVEAYKDLVQSERILPISQCTGSSSEAVGELSREPFFSSLQYAETGLRANPLRGRQAGRGDGSSIT